MTNSFLHPISEVHFDSYKPEDVESAMIETEKLAWERINAALALKPEERTFDNTVLAFTRANDEFATIEGIVSHLKSVLAGVWNEPSKLANRYSAEFSNKTAFHKGIYDALVEVQASFKETELSAPRRKLLDEMVQGYERNGIALAEEQQEELKRLRVELKNASETFGINVVEAEDAAGLLVDSSEQLAGMSEKFITRCKTKAQERNEEGYWVDFDTPTFVQIMSDCSVAKTRHDFYDISVTRAAETNEPVVQSILTLRRRIAQILGYKDWSDYALELRMVKNGETASTFVADLAAKYEPQMLKDVQNLRDFARTLENDDTLELDVSDINSGYNFYYSARLSATQSGISDEDLKYYFSLDNVIKEMFVTLETLYGLSFKPIKIPGWHDDVQAYEIYDGDKHLSTVWCDWNARKGKHGGAWANAFYIADRANGSFDKPHLGLVAANFDRPVNGHARLTLRDVETVWHEFGHFIHLTVGVVELTEQSSFSCRWDFVEAPSQIMENWVWQPEVMAHLAHHEVTGQGLSDKDLASLVAQHNFEAGRIAMRQISFATIDLALHRDYDPMARTDVAAFARELKQKSFPMPIRAHDAGIMTFSHIFDGGYASAYYSYKWAEVIEADFFAKFMAEGFMNSTVGNEYRTKVLARGSEVEPSELVQDFLGRQASPEAMLKRDGITT